MFDLTKSRERSLLGEWAAHQGFACVVPENERVRPIAPAFYYAVHTGRPTLVSWRGIKSRTGTVEGGNRRTIDLVVQTYTAAGIGHLDYSVTSRTGSRAPRTFAELELPAGAAAAMPPPCQRAFWRLIQPTPGLDAEAIGRPPGHQLAITPPERIAEYLPPGWFDEYPAIVNTSCRLGHRLDTTVDDIRRALDRGGWMCWSLEYEADLPSGLRV